jgi:hypothetical protein
MLKDRKFKKAWLIFSRDKIVNIFSSRKDSDFIFEYIKDLYCYENFTLREKAVQADYAKGAKYRKEFFEHGGLTISTPHKSDLYREMMFTTREEGLDTPYSRELWKKWEKQPFHFKIGEREILVEARKVYNFSLSGENGNGVLEWDEHDIAGEVVHKTYKEKI